MWLVAISTILSKPSSLSSLHECNCIQLIFLHHTWTNCWSLSAYRATLTVCFVHTEYRNFNPVIHYITNQKKNYNLDGVYRVAKNWREIWIIVSREISHFESKILIAKNWNETLSDKNLNNGIKCRVSLTIGSRSGRTQ